MPVSFKIMPRRNLVLITYEGYARIDDTFAAFGAYLAHPDFKPGQKQLVDLSRVSDFEKDYARIMSLQAKKAEAFAKPGHQTMIVYYAPDEETYRMSRLIMRSWEGTDAVVPLIQQTEEGALAVLGEHATSFADLDKRQA